MQVFRQIEPEAAALVGWGVRVMLLSPDGGQGPSGIAARLAGFGGIVEAEEDLFAAIETMANDATGYGLFVMDCDAFGGLEAGHRAITLMSRVLGRIPVMLVTGDCPRQIFPEDLAAPVVLRAPVSAVSLRVGFEHALRDRVIWQAA